jgi:acyl-CoA thioesterase FadM
VGKIPLYPPLPKGEDLNSLLACPVRIAIGARVTDINDEQILMQYIIVNTGTNQVAAIGEAAIVALQVADKSRVSFPGELRTRILELQLSKV